MSITVPGNDTKNFYDVWKDFVNDNIRLDNKTPIAGAKLIALFAHLRENSKHLALLIDMGRDFISGRRIIKINVKANLRQIGSSFYRVL